MGAAKTFYTIQHKFNDKDNIYANQEEKGASLI